MDTHSLDCHLFVFDKTDRHTDGHMNKVKCGGGRANLKIATKGGGLEYAVLNRHYDWP